MQNNRANNVNLEIFNSKKQNYIYQVRSCAQGLFPAFSQSWVNTFPCVSVARGYSPWYAYMDQEGAKL